MRLVAPSVLSADFLHLSKDIAMVNGCADLFHLDVMDGILVPNLSFGFPVVEAIAKEATLPLDVHLMICRPDRYLDRFIQTGAQMISFHLEACQDAGINPVELLRKLRGNGVKAGLAIDPDVPVEDLFPYIEEADYLLLMSVFAGFGGQKFIPETIGRCAALKAEIDRLGANCLIEVDGGVSASNADALADAGASIFVAGSAVFKADDPAAVCAAIRGQE